MAKKQSKKRSRETELRQIGREFRKLAATVDSPQGWLEQNSMEVNGYCLFKLTMPIMLKIIYTHLCSDSGRVTSDDLSALFEQATHIPSHSIEAVEILPDPILTSSEINRVRASRTKDYRQHLPRTQEVADENQTVAEFVVSKASLCKFAMLCTEEESDLTKEARLMIMVRCGLEL